MAYYESFAHFLNHCNKMLRSKNVNINYAELKKICKSVYSKSQTKTLASAFYFNLKEDCLEDNFDIKETLSKTILEQGERMTKAVSQLLLNGYEQNNEVYKMLCDLSTKSGLYFLYDNHQQLKYIGKSINLGHRILGSSEERKLYHFKYSLIENVADLHILEVYAINLYKPERNKDCLSSHYPSFELKLPELSKLYSLYKPK